MSVTGSNALLCSQVTAKQAVVMLEAVMGVRDAAARAVASIGMAGMPPNHPLQERLVQVEKELEALLVRMNPVLFF